MTAGHYFGAFITGQFENPRDSYLVLLFTAGAIGVIGVLYALLMEQSCGINEEQRTPFFQLSSVKDCFKTVFKEKENRAAKLVACFIFFSGNIFVITPEFEYLMGRLKYKEFDRSMFNYYTGTKNGGMALSALFLLPGLLAFFNITDLVLMIFGLTSTILGYLVVMFRWESKLYQKQSTFLPSKSHIYEISKDGIKQ